jgi:hypothetical protein
MWRVWLASSVSENGQVMGSEGYINKRKIHNRQKKNVLNDCASPIINLIN